MLLATMQTCDFVPSQARKWAARSEAILIRLLGNEQVSPSQEMRQCHHTMAGKWKGGLDNSIHMVIIKIGNYQPWLFKAQLLVQRQGTTTPNDSRSLPAAPPPPGKAPTSPAGADSRNAKGRPKSVFTRGAVHLSGLTHGWGSRQGFVPLLPSPNPLWSISVPAAPQ